MFALARAVRRADLVAVDVLDQDQTAAGDPLAAEREGMFQWLDAVELGTIVSGQTGGGTVNNAIILFESQGWAIEDVALAARLYDLAQGRGVGRMLPFWEA